MPSETASSLCEMTILISNLACGSLVDQPEIARNPLERRMQNAKNNPFLWFDGKAEEAICR